MEIREILLVHKNTFVPSFKWSDYRRGRSVEGLVYCVSGCAAFDYGGDRFTLRAGQALFLPANSSYTVECAGEEPFVHYTVNFRLEKPDGEPGTATAFTEIVSGKRRHMTATDSASIYGEPLERLLSIWQNKANGYRVMAKALLYELLYLYFTDAGRSMRNRGDYNRLLPARRMLDAHYREELHTSDLAELCGLSETHFRRLFLRVFGCTPTEYRLRRRIVKAKDYLISGQYSVSEAARAVGFSDPNYFTRVFRAQTGISPTEYLEDQSI